MFGQGCISYRFFNGNYEPGPPAIRRIRTSETTRNVVSWGTYFCWFRPTAELGYSYSFRAWIKSASASTDLWFYRHEGRNLYTYFGEQVSQGNYPAGPPWYYVNPFRNKSGATEDALPGTTKRNPFRQYRIRPEPYYFMATIQVGQWLEIECKMWIEDAYARDGLASPPHLTDDQPASGVDNKDDEIAVDYLGDVELFMVRI